MNKVIKQIDYINQTTGEYHSKQSYVDAQFDDEEGYLFWCRKSSIKSFLDVPLPNTFTWAEKGRINELKHYMLKDNQLLAYKSKNCIKPIGIGELCKIVDLRDRACKDFVKKLKDNGIIKEIKTNGNVYYAVNPIYFLKSKRITLTMFLWFQDEFRRVLPLWVIDKFLDQAHELNPDIEIIE